MACIVVESGEESVVITYSDKDKVKIDYWETEEKATTIELTERELIEVLKNKVKEVK